MENIPPAETWASRLTRAQGVTGEDLGVPLIPRTPLGSSDKKFSHTGRGCLVTGKKAETPEQHNRRRARPLGGSIVHVARRSWPGFVKVSDRKKGKDLRSKKKRENLQDDEVV